MQPFGGSESTTWLGSLEDLSAPRGWLKISCMSIFSMLWLRAGLLILKWMASLVSGIVFIVLVYYLEVGDVCSGWLLEMLFANALVTCLLYSFTLFS